MTRKREPMNESLVDLSMRRDEKVEDIPTLTERGKTELETQSTRLTDATRKREFRTAIEASTERLLRIALTGSPIDADPEAA
jgi:hypothetical protein